MASVFRRRVGQVCGRPWEGRALSAVSDHTPLQLDAILQGDCRQVLQSLPEECVDLVFADPPYNLQLGTDELLRPNQTHVDGVDDSWDAFDSFAEYDRFTEEWLRACRRVMKPTATLWVIGTYHNIHRVGRILQDMGYWLLNEVCWVKTNPMPQFRGVRFTNAHETLLWAKKSEKQKRYTFNYQLMKALNGDKQMRSDWLLPICTGAERLRVGGEKVHSTQKPEALLERVILSSSNAGDVVLDPFFGSGTTGAVAKRLGRHWLGVERDPVYIGAAQERIAAVEAGSAPQLALDIVEPRRLPKVSFATLVAAGEIAPGTCLYLNQSPSLVAEVQSNGDIRFGDAVGSIHSVGRQARRRPASNRWAHRLKPDAPTGEKVRIDSSII